MRPKRGKYRDSPTETLESCRFCDRSFHHMGLKPHEAWCRKRTPTERKDGKGGVLLSRKAQKMNLPVVLRKAEGPEEERVSVSVSLDRTALGALLKSLRLEPK